MKKVIAGLLILFAVAAYAVDMKWSRNIQEGSGPELMGMYRRLTDPIGTASGTTEGFTIRRPGLMLRLGPGQLLMEGPDDSNIRGLFYEGAGTLSFQVQDPIERKHMEFFLGSDSLKDHPVEEVYILPLGGGTDLPVVETELLEVTGNSKYGKLKHALHEGGMGTLANVLNRELHGEEDLFILFRMDGDVWAYVYDSTENEEVSLSRLGNPPHYDVWWWDRVVSMHLDRAGNLVALQHRKEVEAKIPLDVLHYSLDVTLDKDGIVRPGSFADVRLNLLKPMRALNFSMTPMLHVSRVRLNGETELPFIKEEYSWKAYTQDSGLTVLLPEPMKGEMQIRIEYAGDLFEDTFGCQFPHDPTNWYPRIFDADGSTFAMTARVPKDYDILGVGELVERSPRQDGEGEQFLYEMKEKIRSAGIAYGKLKHSVKTFHGVEVDIAIPDDVNTTQLNRHRKDVFEEVEAALKTYSEKFGPPPYKTLRVSMGGGGTSYSFPTLILLSVEVWARTGSSWPEQVVGHEVAHQWWSSRSAPATYRDHWILESLPEFASLLYLRDKGGLPDMQKYLSHFYHQLQDQTEILRIPKNDFGPICLGGRLYTTLDPEAGFQEIVYNKGAWNLLTLSRLAGFTQLGEASFYEGLAEFRARNQDQLVTTEDFVQAMSDSMKMDMGWYFKQCLETTTIPTVKVTTRVEGSGSDLKLIVEGTQDTDMNLPIPIQAVTGKKNKWSKIREYLFFLKGPSATAEFPLPFKPDDVIVDGNRFVLAHYE